jgi:hypothetical protein
MAEEILAQARLKELFSYDEETGIFRRKTTITHNAKKGSIAGTLNKKLGYVIISVDNNQYYLHRLVWLYVNGSFPSKQIDHINRDRSDNRICNLREVTSGQNKQNTNLRIDNKSGAKGVFWYEPRKKWIAYIRLNGKRHSLGYHVNFNDAVLARKKAEDKFFTHHKDKDELRTTSKTSH